MKGDNKMWSEQELDKQLSIPSDKLINDIKQIRGDIMVLGAGGKMGPTLCLLAQNACKEANVDKKITAVSRFSDKFATDLLTTNNIHCIKGDLLDKTFIDNLPDCENIIYMAGRKFGTNSQEYLTWAMNVWLPSRVAERYKNSRIVVFSSGNVYPQLPVNSGGAISGK